MATETPPSDAPPKAPPTVYEEGQIIGGKYLLEQQIGEGGMGSVWRARNMALEVAVAVKLVAGTSDLELLRARLVREARTAARLRHPAIVQIFDVGETDQGDPFIVMELLEGQTLGELLDSESRLPATEAVRLLLPIADALHAAHARGLVHRDVKPDNVFIVRDGVHLRPKLVDFGIVKVEGGKERHDQITERGTFVGTPAYMSPEQARGREDLDRSTDIWAFAVTLFECVSGHVPFVAENYNALLRTIVEEPAPPLSLYDIEDARLSSIIATGLAKDPKRRWPSMQSFSAALSSWLAEQKPGPEVIGPLSSRRTLAYPPARPGSLASALLPSISVTELGPSSRQRWLVAAGVSGTAILALVFWLARSQDLPVTTGSASAAPSVSQAATNTVPVPAAAPSSLPLPSASASAEEGAASVAPPSASVPAVGSAPIVVAPRIGASARPTPRPRDNAPPPKPAHDPKPKPKLDLMEPF